MCSSSSVQKKKKKEIGNKGLLITMTLTVFNHYKDTIHCIGKHFYSNCRNIILNSATAVQMNYNIVGRKYLSTILHIKQ